MNTKKPLNNTHEIHLATLAEKATEQFLDIWILQKVNKVINVEAEREWFLRNMTFRVVGISNKACEETRIFERRCQTNRKENFIDLFIPLLWAAAKAIQRPEKKPIFIRLSLGITRGRSNNCDLFGRKDALAKGIFATTLTKRAALLYGQ